MREERKRMVDACGRTLRCYQLSYNSHPDGRVPTLPRACHETDKGAEKSG